MSDNAKTVKKPSDPEQKEAGKERWEFGLWAVLFGVTAIVLSLLLITLWWNNQEGIAALGVVVSPIAAIVSAYFGIQYSQKAAADAADVRKDAEKSVENAMADKEQTIEGLRGQVLSKLEDAAKATTMDEDAAAGFAARAWDQARAAIK